MKLLANTGFLFTDLPFPDRLAAAAAAGFDGVEFHDEIQRHDASAIAARLAELGLSIGGLNTRMGDSTGTAALPGREAEFIADITAAHAAARIVGSGAIHVTAGRGETDEATYLANLQRACDATDRLILIEPICAPAIPGYHLSRLAHGLELADRLGPHVRVMFDWFHVATELGPDAATAALVAHRGLIGHVQAASVNGRNEPGPEVIAMFLDAGFASVGLEYRPLTDPARHVARLHQALYHGDDGIS